MKKAVQVEVAVCDFCGTEQSWGCDACLRCGKHICYECKKTKAVEYTHGVHFSGSGDGAYCVTCNAAMEANPDQLFTAYQRIAALKAEARRFQHDFEARREAAEVALKKARGGA